MRLTVWSAQRTTLELHFRGWGWTFIFDEKKRTTGVNRIPQSVEGGDVRSDVKNSRSTIDNRTIKVN
jgi:hypothetical protein